VRKCVPHCGFLPGECLPRTKPWLGGRAGTGPAQGRINLHEAMLEGGPVTRRQRRLTWTVASTAAACEDPTCPFSAWSTGKICCVGHRQQKTSSGRKVEAAKGRRPIGARWFLKGRALCSPSSRPSGSCASRLGRMLRAFAPEGALRARDENPRPAGVIPPRLAHSRRHGGWLAGDCRAAFRLGPPSTRRARLIDSQFRRISLVRKRPGAGCWRRRHAPPHILPGRSCSENGYV